ncbi:MAG TPA: DNA translocase FtsK, partial [Anaerolineales bacterium]|nr:DNA translocase FtsK [Anaerolineales bacterium]
MPHQQEPFPSSTPAATWQDTALNTFLRFQRFLSDAVGLFLLAFALIMLLALVGWTEGALISPLANLFRKVLGYGSVFIALIILWVGWQLVRRREITLGTLPWGRIVALEIGVFALLALFTVFGGASIARAEAGLDGGLIGWGLAETLGLAMGGFLRGMFLFMVLALGIIAGMGWMPALLTWLRRTLEGETAPPIVVPTPAPVTEPESPSVVTVRDVAPAPVAQRRPVELPPQFRKKFRLPTEKAPTTPPPPRDQSLPPLDLLLAGKHQRPHEGNINLTAGLIEKTLAEFGVPATVTGFQVGPTITQFAVEPGFVERPGPDGKPLRQKVRVSQITSLARDLALALSADRIRIEAPVPGRSYLGIEVPNAAASTVRLRPIIESEAFYKVTSPLAMGIGLDVSGKPVVADLAKMPHLLIAGTTGSGKSVCISALTTCLVMNNTPQDLRLVMIDPKKVELVRFNGLPHLMGQVETNLERILGVLRWVVMEMDRRYKLLEKHRARNLDGFNKKMAKMKNAPEQPMPHIVVLIDELADLMLSAGEQTEPALVRLAQLARATGIHLIVATQRPSTDVVTGLIKANFPARLAFAVASSIDSRVILDNVGAETLLGNGDMLFLPPDAPAPLRAQGAFISDAELEKVVQYWHSQYPQGQSPAPWDDMLAQESMLADRDDLIERAIEIVRKTQRASASHLQRQLRIGYPRAARLVDELEGLGIIGPATG